MTIFAALLLIFAVVSFAPNYLGHSDNYIMANPMQTPSSIVPEWYLLPFYAILRSIPNKLLGVIAMFASLLILLGMPLLDTSRVRGSQFRPLMRWSFWILVADFFLLMHIGSEHVEAPWIVVGQVATAVYFGWFLFLVPVIGIIENTLMDIALAPETDISETSDVYPYTAIASVSLPYINIPESEYSIFINSTYVVLVYSVYILYNKYSLGYATQMIQNYLSKMKLIVPQTLFYMSIFILLGLFLFSIPTVHTESLDWGNIVQYADFPTEGPVIPYTATAFFPYIALDETESAFSPAIFICASLSTFVVLAYVVFLLYHYFSPQFQSTVVRTNVTMLYCKVTLIEVPQTLLVLSVCTNIYIFISVILSVFGFTPPV